MQLVLILIAITVVSLTLRFLAFIITAFAGHIILLDSVILALIAGGLGKGLLDMHSAFALVFGIVCFFFLFWLQHTNIGFYVIGFMMSLIWGFIFGMISYLFTSDTIWFFVIWALSTIVVISLHFHARNTSLGSNDPYN